MQIVTFGQRPEPAKTLTRKLKVKPLRVRFDRYPSGELKVRAPSRVAPRVAVIGDVTEDPASLVSLVFLAAALRSSGAKHLTLIAPWIAYGRQDRAAQPGEAPVGLEVARILGQSFDRIITLDAHSPAFVRGFGGRLHNILPGPACLPAGLLKRLTLVVAPDEGARSRAEHWARQLRIPSIVLHKRRQGKKVSTSIRRADVPSVRDSRILLVDDMTDTGSTLLAAARLLRKHQAREVRAFVTHVLDASVLRGRLRPEITSCDMAYEHAGRRLAAAVQENLRKEIR